MCAAIALTASGCHGEFEKPPVRGPKNAEKYW